MKVILSGTKAVRPNPEKTTKIYTYKPGEKEMKEVKKITITRRPV